MPTYDYRCTVCGHEIEVVHGVHDDGPEACPKCGGPMRKAFVVPTIHFKGSGWAKKDRGASTATKAARAADAGSKGGDEGGSKPSGETTSGETTGGETTGGGAKKSEGGDGSGSTRTGDGGTSRSKGPSESRSTASADGADGGG